MEVRVEVILAGHATVKKKKVRKEKEERAPQEQGAQRHRQTTAEKKETLPSICPTGQGLRSHSPTLCV